MAKGQYLRLHSQHVSVERRNLTYRVWDGRDTGSIIPKASELLKLFLIEAVPLDFVLGLSSSDLRKVLGTNPRMKIKHAVRRRGLLKGMVRKDTQQ